VRYEGSYWFCLIRCTKLWPTSFFPSLFNTSSRTNIRDETEKQTQMANEQLITHLSLFYRTLAAPHHINETDVTTSPSLRLTAATEAGLSSSATDLP
jgi:hypothetical protein